MSYPASEEDTCYAGNESRYPGVDEGAGYPVMRYSEDLKMGYRWHQSQDIAPMFAFGYGLSYTEFELSGLSVDSAGVTGGADAAGTVEITVDVANVGERDGAEVVQVYLQIPVDGQPPRRLVGFDKVRVAAGESTRAQITLALDSSAHPFGVWDANEQSFVVKLGTYTLHVGNSSDNTPLSAEVTIG